MQLKKSGLLFDRIVFAAMYSCLFLFSLTSILPIMQVITVSLSPIEVVNRFGFHLIPTEIDWSSYRKVFAYDMLWVAYGNTILRTVLGTFLTVAITFMGSYALAKKTLPNRSFWTGFIVLTMFFSGGLIPTYILIKNLQIMNTIWVLVLPSAVSVFFMLVVRNFLFALPEELEESAKIDGAGDLFILWKIAVPLSMPVIATLSLYTAVGHWNAWFDSMIYIHEEKKQVLQLLLRKIVLEGTVQPIQGESGQEGAVNVQSMKMATLVVSILPIMGLYPFLQKYFVKGMMVGSVKG